MVSYSCGLSLLKLVIILTSLNLVCEVIGVSLAIVHLANAIKNSKQLRKTSEEISDDDKYLYFSAAVAIAYHTIHMALHLFQAGLSTLLLFGALQKNICKCKIWLNITAVILTINVVSTVVNYIFGTETGRPSWTIGPTLFLILFKGYMLWIVHSFIKFIRFNNHTMRYEHPDQNFQEINQEDDQNPND